MKYQNFTFIPGYDPLYGFEIKSEAGVPLDITSYQFRLEAFDDSGTRIFLEDTPVEVDGHWVYFTISPTKAVAFANGNYNYRLIAVNTLGQTRQVYKGFITVDAPVEQDPPPTDALTASDITDFDQAAIDAVTDFVTNAIAAATFGDASTPVGMVAGGTADNSASIKAKHDELLALGGGVLTLPAGTYGIKDMDWWHPSVSLVGKGRNATVLKILANAVSCGISVLARAQDATALYAWNPEFKSFHLTGQKQSQTNTVDGIRFAAANTDPAYNTYGSKAYTSGRLVDLEIDSCSGDGVKIEGGRQRGFLSNVRSTGNTGRGCYIAGNDSIVTERCGFGNNGLHSLMFNGCSGAIVKGVNVWGNPTTRNQSCVAVHFQNCNSVNMTGCVVNDTISVYGGGTNDDRGILIAGNTLKPHSVLFSSDGVTVDGDADINCHIRIRGANNVVATDNVYDAAQTAENETVLRFNKLIVARDSAAARVDVTISTEVDTRPWAASGFEPFIVSNDSQIIYTIFETTRAIARSNGTSTFGINPTTDADTRYNLLAQKSRFYDEMAMEGPVTYPTPSGSRYIGLTEGSTTVLASNGVIYVFTGADLTAATVQLPATASDGRMVIVTFLQNIGTLTLTAASGDIFGGVNPFPRSVTTCTSFTFLYKLSNHSWNLVSTLPGSALTQAQITAGAVGVVGYTADGRLVMANSIVTLDTKVDSILKTALDAISPTGINVNKMYYVSDYKGGVMVKSNGTIWEEVAPPKAKHYVDPYLDHNANNQGVSTTAALTAALSAAVTPAISGVTYGRGKPVIPTPGVYKTGNQALSGHVSLVTMGATGSVVFQMDHAGVSASTQMFTLQEDGALTNGIDGQSDLTNIVIDGMRTDTLAQNHGQAVHGIAAPTSSANKLIPVMNKVVISRCTGDAVKFNGFHEYKAVQSKFIDNKGYGLNLVNSKNGSATQVSYLRNLTGAVYLQNCDEMTFGQSVFAPPTGGTFIGRWTIEVVTSNNIKFDACTIQGPVKFTGTNQNAGATDKFQRRSITFTNTHFQVSKDVKDGYTTNHPGDPNYVYDGQIEVMDFSGINLGSCTFRFGAAMPQSGDLAARPAYFVKFTSAGGQTSPELTLARGSVQITSVDFVTREMREGVVPVIMPFTKRPFNFEDGVTWEGLPWNAPRMFRKDSAPRGWVLADGTTGLSVADYPLAYLAGATSRTLDDGITTFTIQDIDTAVPSDEYGWYLRAY